MAFLAGLGIAVLLIGLTIPLSILNGAVLCKLWEWFLVPFGLPEIGLAHAIGVAMIISYTASSTSANKGEEPDMVKGFMTGLMRPLFALFFGYIVKSFM